MGGHSGSALLTENASYVLSNKDGVFEGQDILAFADKGPLGLYLPFKALNNNPVAQRELLEKVVNVLVLDSGYAQADNTTREYLFQNNTSKNPVADSSRFDDLKAEGGSLGRIIFYDPEAIERKSEGLALETYDNAERMMLKAHSGLVSLRQALRQLPEGEELYIVLPHTISESVEPSTSIGYKITNSSSTTRKFEVLPLLASDYLGDGGLVLVKFSHGRGLKEGVNPHSQLLEDKVAKFLIKQKSVQPHVVSILDRLQY